jgi:hypothetical protein
LATEYTTARGVRSYSTTPLYPTTRCYLEINGDSIHSHYRQNLRFEAAMPPLMTYLTQKHTWEPYIPEVVNWEAMRMAARTYSSTEVHLLKLVHDRLPFRDHVARFQPWIVNTCHYCDHLDTMDHLQRSHCNPASAMFRMSICDKVTEYITTRAYPEVFGEAFIAALIYWLYDTPPTCILGTAVFDAQQSIGWRLLTRGFVAIEWTTLLQQTLLQTSPGVATSTPDVTSMLSGLIKVMWTEVGELWIAHLAMIHEKEKTRISPVSLEAMRNRVRTIHSLKDQTLPMHHHYFHKDVEAYLQRATLQSMTTYVEHYYPVIKACVTTRELGPATEPQSHVESVIHHNVGEQSHRKRNRRRTIIHRIAAAIRAMLVHTHRPTTPG